MMHVLGQLAQFQHRLLTWYRTHRRDLPWRPRPGCDESQRVDPYHVLVSEAMLQQTQVATVIPYFLRFIERFPTLKALANAPEQDVLRLWQGLGYYSRARNLQAAARMIVERFGGQVPASVDELLQLPGVGRYTAGAIASIAHDSRAPIVDGNVIRVICRLDRIETDPRVDRSALDQVWQRAEAILPDSACGDFNSALMELGATVCLPRSPACLICPVAEHCAAREAGVQELIPPPKAAKPTPMLRRLTLIVRSGDRFLIEQRPATGRWAGMWQFVTVDAPARLGRRLDASRASTITGLRVSAARHIGQISHTLTHRRYTFEVFACSVEEGSADVAPRRWVSRDELDRFPLPRPHLKMLALLDGAAIARA